MDKSFISVEDLCKILESCSKMGVAVLKFRDLEVSFTSPQSIGPSGQKLPEITENVIREQNQSEKSSVFEDEMDLREQQIAELLITDPLRAEELMAQGDLKEE